jgi:hypothetical protein
MRIKLFGVIGVGLALAATGTFAAKKPAATHPAAKPAPSCAALAFRPLPGGTADGEQTAGTYKSRLAHFELRGTVQNGAPANYYLVANGARIASAAQTVAPAAGDCAVAKKMPRPGVAAASCTGDRFTVVIAHAGNKRFALLYAQNGGAASFCDAGSF